MLTSKKNLLSAGLIFLLSSNIALAQTTSSVTGTVAVTITLEAGCKINSSAEQSNIDFGEIDFGTHSTLFDEANAQALHSGQSIEVLCSPGLEPEFKIISGENDSQATGGASHAMKNSNSSHYVPYSLFLDAGYNSLVTTNTSYPLAGNADGENPQALELYGRAQGAPGLAAGTYHDTLAIELEF